MNESAIQNIGGKLHAEFDKNAALRRPFEQRWIDDLRQYQGVYPPEVLKKLTEQNRSTLYLRKTKAKVDSIKAHLMDLLFPAKGERNWDISPSTTPEVHPSLLFEARGMHDGANAYPLGVVALTRPVKNVVTNGSVTFTFATTTLTRSAGSWLTDGYKVGDMAASSTRWGPRRPRVTACRRPCARSLATSAPCGQ